jgi:hypothetical protein
MYLLEPPPVQALAQTSPLSARVGTVTVAAPYRDRTFVVREADLRFENDYYHEYVVAPAPMIAEAMARALAQSKAFAKVIPPGAPAEADLTVDAFVGRFSRTTATRRRRPPSWRSRSTWCVPTARPSRSGRRSIAGARRSRR